MFFNAPLVTERLYITLKANGASVFTHRLKMLECSIRCQRVIEISPKNSLGDIYLGAPIAISHVQMME